MSQLAFNDVEKFYPSIEKFVDHVLFFVSLPVSGRVEHHQLSTSDSLECSSVEIFPR